MRNAALTPAMLRTGRLVARLLRLGLPIGPLRILETTGRISRQPRTTPVVLTRHQGEDWLVSPFGDTDWVRNARSQPNVHLIRLGRRHPVRLTEVDIDTAAVVLQTFLRRFRLVPFVPPAFTAEAGSDLATFLAEAHRHPVFHISKPPRSSRLIGIQTPQPKRLERRAVRASSSAGVRSEFAQERRAVSGLSTSGVLLIEFALRNLKGVLS